jgi:exonuclease VII small subunit
MTDMERFLAKTVVGKMNIYDAVEELANLAFERGGNSYGHGQDLLEMAKKVLSIRRRAAEQEITINAMDTLQFSSDELLRKRNK